jgi:uncharacterized RDD family membrane protein YckC
MNSDNRYQPPKAEVADVNSEEMELATRGARFGAAVIDGLLIAFVIFPVMFATGYLQEAMSGIQPLATQMMYGSLGFVLYVVFHGYLLQKSGQTIGKRLVGTRIVSVDDNRVVPLWKILTMRQLPITVLSQVPMVGQVVALVDCLFIFRADKRCAHDLIAGTKVVKASTAWKKQDE